MMESIDDIVRTLDLEPHPEGGFYRRTYRNTRGPSGPSGEHRGHASSIYYLQMPEYSRWHRVDGDELWFWHGGGPLTLETRKEDGSIYTQTLGPLVSEGQQLQLLAPASTWQRAISGGPWTLVSCAVSPGFLFETYELEGEE